MYVFLFSKSFVACKPWAEIYLYIVGFFSVVFKNKQKIRLFYSVYHTLLKMRHFITNAENRRWWLEALCATFWPYIWHVHSMHKKGKQQTGKVWYHLFFNFSLYNSLCCDSEHYALRYVCYYWSSLR